jgi:hypothetical protein
MLPQKGMKFRINDPDTADWLDQYPEEVLELVLSILESRAKPRAPTQSHNNTDCA